MKLYSTNNHQHQATLKEAVLRGLAPDGGLYTPQTLPTLSPQWLKHSVGQSFQSIAGDVTEMLFSDEVPSDVLQRIVNESYNFALPLVPLDQTTTVLELFHGPTLAFKDVAARFMARLIGYYVEQDQQELTIIVATSGDTGSAVASGFLNVPGINVVILYPSGRVSHLQEQQLTTMGHNITALEIQGSFDDCQQLVKQALQDQWLRQHIQLGSANSINIARLLPQSFYYIYAYTQLADQQPDIVFSVPSGNFGNLTAGLIAKRMGLPVQKFIAATNSNDVIPEFLHTGEFETRPSQPTISNAMDVGNPSNFARMQALYNNDIDAMRQDIFGAGFSDDMTLQAMSDAYQRYHYVMDPHTAVGYLGYQAYNKRHPSRHGIILATAHPVKFKDIVEPVIKSTIHIPEQLQMYLHRSKHSITMSTAFSDFKEYLLDTYAT